MSNSNPIDAAKDLMAKMVKAAGDICDLQVELRHLGPRYASHAGRVEAIRQAKVSLAWMQEQFQAMPLAAQDAASRAWNKAG